MRQRLPRRAAVGGVLAAALLTTTPAAPVHPSLLFDAAGLDAIRVASKGEGTCFAWMSAALG